MPRLFQKRTETIGLPPGSLVHIGERKTDQVRITVIGYDETVFHQTEAVEEYLFGQDKPAVTWISVNGLHQVQVLERLGTQFGLHPLIMEDILNTAQRPKIEDMENYVFVTLKALHIKNDADAEIEVEQISLVLGFDFVLSFQEQAEGVFDSIRERIRGNKGRIRKMRADYLMYALLDTIVDGYFVVLEWIDEKIEDLEEELVVEPTTETLQAINNLKRVMVLLRRSVWPLREIISHLERRESVLIQDETNIYLRDLYDHTIQVIDAIETYRDVLSGMLDIYLSSVSNRMNEVMKVLTVISTLFIPLTFIVGVYGMNFKYLPELEWRWAYPLVWLVMIVISALMIVYFRKKKWL
jgi:magnesium transporter